MAEVQANALVHGSRVRQARQEAGLSQPQLAEAAGMSVQALGDIERKNAQPSAPNLFRIATATRREMQWFFGVEDGSPAAPPPPPPPPERASVEAALRELEAAQTRLTSAQERLRRALTGSQPDRVADEPLSCADTFKNGD